MQVVDPCQLHLGSESIPAGVGYKSWRNCDTSPAAAADLQPVRPTRRISRVVTEFRSAGDEDGVVVEQALIATGVIGVLLIIAAGAAAVVVVRGVRRRFRIVRSLLLAAQGSRRFPSLLPMSGAIVSASIGSPGWWVVQNRRHRMWRAVSSAEHAVSVARRADVLVGDLPSLADRLRAAAVAADAVLRASGRQGPLGEQDCLDCDRIVAAASDLRRAALSSLSSGSHANTEAVVSAVHIEVAAVAAGLRAAPGRCPDWCCETGAGR